MNNSSSLSIEEKVRQATLTPAPRPEFAEELWRHIATHPHPQPAPSRGLTHLFARPVWAAAVIWLIVMLGIAVIGPQKVVAAFRSLLGYVPGIGFVQSTHTTRMVEVPVRVEHDGVVVTVESGLVDAQGVHLNLKVVGLPTSKLLAGPLSSENKEQPYLQLPSGQHIQLISGLSSRGKETNAKYLFGVVPPDVDQVVLVLPNLPGLGKGEAVGDWQIPLHFRNLTQKDQITASLPVEVVSEKRNGIALVLEEVAQDVDYTILKVRLDTGNSSISPNNEWWKQLSLTDQDGKIYPLTDMQTVDLNNETIRVLKTTAMSGTERLSLTLRKLELSISFPNPEGAPGFRFDPGRSPQIGQRWDLNQTIEANNYKLHFLRVEMIQEEQGGVLFRFALDPQPGLSTLLLGCGFHDSCGGGGASVWPGVGPLITDLSFKRIPNEPFSVRVGTLMVSVDGPWQVNWQPLPLSPEVLARPTATPTQTPIPPMPTPTAAIQQSVAEKVLRLLEKGFSRLYGQPGWVHIASENIESEDSGFLGPKHTIGEYWQYVDVEGKITKKVLVVKDPNGAVWQTIARVGGKQVNFTAQTAMEDQNLIEQAQRDPLPEYVETGTRQGAQVLMEETELDGKRCWLVTIIYVNDPPVQIAGTEKTIASTELKTWIDQETGFILLRVRIDDLVDGTSIVSQHLRTMTQERVDTPPQEILYYLNQVGTP